MSKPSLSSLLRPRAIIVMLCGALFAVTLYLTYRYTADRAALESAALQSAQVQADRAATHIDSVFVDVMQIANTLADDLTRGDQPYAAIQDRLAAEVETRPDIDGIAVTFEPFVYQPHTRLYQYYRYRENGVFAVLDGATYDYTTPPGTPDAPNTNWYHAPLDNGAVWNEPFLATGAGKVLIEYGVPFYRTGAQPTRANAAGVVTVDYSVQDMRALINGLELGATGYGFVITPSGTFLAHPIADYVVNQSMFAVADAIGSAALRQAVERALAGEAVRIELDDPVTGELSWTFFQPLPATGWVLGVVLNKADYALDARTTALDQMRIAAAAALTVFFAALVIAFPQGYSTRELWAISGLVSLLCLALIVLTWVVTGAVDQAIGVRVTDRAALGRYIDNYTRTSRVAQPPIEIPTGVLIQALEFPDPTTVRINGLVWQSYPAGDDAPAIERGVMLPGRIGEESTYDEVSRVVIDGREVIVWYIGMTIKQAFDPALFPFDNRLIDLRLMPRDLIANVVLTPDLASYDLINPRLLPGLDADAAIHNWRVIASTFTYQQPTYTTTFGIPSRAAATAPPELHFTIATQRGFVGPFVAYLLPGIVVMLMLFGFLINERQMGDKDEINGALNFGAALFFVIAVAHSSLRDTIGAIGLTYLEFLYLLLYLAIIAVVGNTFLVVKRPQMRMIRFRGNLAIKLAYFPVLLGVLLLLTLVTFFG